jgi:hypothetical protein
VPQSIYLRKSLAEELLDRALLLLKKVESQKTETHRWASGMYSPKAVKKMMGLLEGDDALRSEFPEVQDKIGQHVNNKIAQRGLMHPREINGRVHAEYDDDMRRDRRNVKTVFDPHGGEIKKKKELLDYIKGLTQMIAYQYDLRPDEENSSFSFTFAHRGGQNYEPVTLDDDGNRITDRRQAAVEKYDAIVEPITDEDGKSRFVIKTIVNDGKHNPHSVDTTPMPPHNHIDLTSQEPTMFSRDPIGDGEFDSKQHWEEGGFRVESDFHQRHPIVNPLPEMPTKDTSGKQQKGIVTGLDDRKGIIQTLKDMEMPHPQTNKNMFAPKQVRGDNTALRLDWTGGKHKPGWNNHVDDMHGMIRSAIESLPEEHRESMGEAMFDSFHQSFDGMSPSHFELNRDGMRDVPGYSNSMANHFNDYQWMLKALMSMDRSLLLLKAVMPSGEDGYRDPRYLDEDEQIWHDEADEDLRAKTNDLMSYLQNLSPEEKLDVTRAQGDELLNNNLEGVYACKDGKCGHLPDDERHKRNLELADQYLLETMMGSWMPDANLNEDAMEGLLYQDMDRAAFPQGQGRDWTAEEGFRAHAVAPEKWRKLAGEPMEIALQLLKERKSPEAFAHKLEYDKKYQKNPKRVKYRVQLNRERRKRGIYGKGGKDVSHTQGNKLTLENPHSNRARHFKNRGTLRRVKVR